VKRISLRAEKELHAALKRAADAEGEELTPYASKLLEKAVLRLLADASASASASLARKELRRELRALENRILKLLAVAAGAANTSAHFSTQCIADVSRQDAAEAHKVARTKAVEYLRRGAGNDAR